MFSRTPKLPKEKKTPILVHNFTGFRNKSMNEGNYFTLPSLKKPVFPGRRTLSITLRMPNIDISNKKTSPTRFKPSVEIIRTISVSGQYRSTSQAKKKSLEPKALRQTMMSFQVNNHPDVTPYCFSPIRSKYSPLPLKIQRAKDSTGNIPEIIIKSEKKNPNSDSLDSAMHEYLIEFYKKVKKKYQGIYFEIDREKKGYFVLDEIIDFFIMKEMQNTGKTYEMIKAIAKDAYKVFKIVSESNRIYKQDFFGLCSVFEHNKGGEIDFADQKIVCTLKDQVIELKELFRCFTTKKTVDIKAVLVEINYKERITKCRQFVESEKINFPRFLRCIPFFVWMYNNISKLV